MIPQWANVIPEFKVLDTTATAATNVHDSVSGSVLYALGLIGSLNTLGGTIWLEDDDNTQLTGKMSVAGNTVFSMGNGQTPFCKTAASKALAVNTTGGGFHGVVQYYEDSSP